MVNGTPITQAGCYGQAVGEIVLRLKDGKVELVSQTLHTVDDKVTGAPKLTKALQRFSEETSRIVFKPRKFKIDEPLAVIEEDWSNTFADLEASRPIGNLMADAIRHATKADVALHAAGMVRASLPKGKTGMQSAYDLFLLAPLGIDSMQSPRLNSAILTATIERLTFREDPTRCTAFPATCTLP